jgi:hypothetical protein
MTGDDEDFGFAEICAVLSERFGTRFKLQNSGGDCVTLVAHLEGGIELLITDCVGTLSPIQRHLDGRAAGFFVGVYCTGLGTRGEHIDLPDRFAYACSETAPADRGGNRRLGAGGVGKRDDPVLARPDSEGRPSPCLRSSIRFRRAVSRSARR